MREAKHTPGPWRVGWDYKPLSPDTGRVIAHAVGPQHCCTGVALDGDRRFLQPDAPTMAKVEADARLIAAAPDMLSALLGLQVIAEQEVTDIAADMVERHATPQNLTELTRWSAVGAAIAKATGKD